MKKRTSKKTFYYEYDSDGNIIAKIETSDLRFWIGVLVGALLVVAIYGILIIITKLL